MHPRLTQIKALILLCFFASTQSMEIPTNRQCRSLKNLCITSIAQKIVQEEREEGKSEALEKCEESIPSELLECIKILTNQERWATNTWNISLQKIYDGDVDTYEAFAALGATKRELVDPITVIEFKKCTGRLQISPNGSQLIKWCFSQQEEQYIFAHLNSDTGELSKINTSGLLSAEFDLGNIHATFLSEESIMIRNSTALHISTNLSEPLCVYTLPTELKYPKSYFLNGIESVSSCKVIVMNSERNGFDIVEKQDGEWRVSGTTIYTGKIREYCTAKNQRDLICLTHEESGNKLIFVDITNPKNPVNTEYPITKLSISYDGENTLLAFSPDGHSLVCNSHNSAKNHNYIHILFCNDPQKPFLGARIALWESLIPQDIFWNTAGIWFGSDSLIKGNSGYACYLLKCDPKKPEKTKNTENNNNASAAKRLKEEKKF